MLQRTAAQRVRWRAEITVDGVSDTEFIYVKGLRPSLAGLFFVYFEPCAYSYSRKQYQITVNEAASRSPLPAAAQHIHIYTVTRVLNTHKLQ